MVLRQCERKCENLKILIDRQHIFAMYQRIDNRCVLYTFKTSTVLPIRLHQCFPSVPFTRIMMFANVFARVDDRYGKKINCVRTHFLFAAVYGTGVSEECTAANKKRVCKQFIFFLHSFDNCVRKRVQLAFIA